MAFSEGLDAGLALLDTLNLDAHLREYHLLHSIRADLLRRSDRPTDALPHYRGALELATSDPERRFLQRRIVDLSTSGPRRRLDSAQNQFGVRAASRPSGKDRPILNIGRV